MNLSDTVTMMNSLDYKERFKAEYFQLKIRINSLKSMLDRYDKGELEFISPSHKLVYEFQLDAMKNYAGLLENRAYLEHIDIERSDLNG